MTGAAGTTVAETEVTGPDVDFDLHGIVGIRVVDARPEDVETLTRQLGPLTAPLAREPEITIRFVDELDGPRPMTYATWPESAGTADDFYLLRGKDGVAARTRFPVDTIGDRCEIVCERRAGHVPHLLAVINMTALRRGVLPLHASAFTHQGVGVLATGWGKGGKTEALLAFAARGARYVGDEWVYLTPDGGMHGVPEPIRLWNWHIDQMPGLRARLPVTTRARLRSLPAVASSAAGLSTRLGGLPASVLRRTAPVLRRQAYVQVPPARIFGADALALHGRVDHVLFVLSHDHDEVSIEPVTGAAVAAHMLASLEEERAPLLAVYRQFRFLFPERRCAVIDEAREIERSLLQRYLGDRPCHVLRHPYPVELRSLVGPVETALGERP
ncbi:hypothetical protein QOZ88_14215 [Blastococcus sp. BMG 814]|uniref:HPr kinase n=1 Tax=Blastococcus carthaginiensis TaxID=3050034 RepID=A0ABT9IFC4_9ACTN|nr:hypothetical protein [Blastococcus carthaginiensis]MDP5183790.1 hypothetical protein [Blastococcus carthaginiensis]